MFLNIFGKDFDLLDYILNRWLILRDFIIIGIVLVKVFLELLEYGGSL